MPRPWDDKSAYLRQAGFELQNWPDLLTAVRRLADEVDPAEDCTNDYGTFYRVEGVLEGPTGSLSVVCIWMKQAVDGTFRFVTLKPGHWDAEGVRVGHDVRGLQEFVALQPTFGTVMLIRAHDALPRFS